MPEYPATRFVTSSANSSGSESDDEKLTEDQAWEIAVRDHPDLRRALESDSLPEELVDDQGNAWSPRLHLTTHAIVERQIANDDPRGVATISKQLANAGVSHHEIRHIMGQAVSTQMWYMMQEGCPFDEERYMRDLHELLETYL